MLKIYFKKIKISREFYRYTRLKSNHFKTNVNYTMILPMFLYKNIEVYNGKKYIPINITKQKIGFLLKDFLFSIKSKIDDNKKELNIKIFK